jgi:class 3 adenylate cyclase/tetratricopeptide (TPR) repeat protein
MVDDPGEGVGMIDRSQSDVQGSTIGGLADERRLVTILFADLAGFTALAERLDPEEVQQLLNRCFDALVPSVERYGGTIDKFIGDAMMVLFGAPVAHDNDAERAVRAALDLRAALVGFNLEQGVDLALHQGISTGRVLAGSVGGGERHDYSVIGDAVNVASRLEDMSAPNEILIGPDTHALAGYLFETEGAGTITVRGRTVSVEVHRILGEAANATVGALNRLRAPLVGREKELQIFAGALDALAQGRGSVLYIEGEAGLGKTRLVAEARKAANEDRFLWLEGQAVSMGQNVSYGPVRQMIEADMGWSPNDDRSERLAKAERRAISLLPAMREHEFDFIAALLGVDTIEHRAWLSCLDEDVFRERLHAIVTQYFRRLALEKPLVLVFEDLHWIDFSSASLIQELALLAGSAPVLLCFVSRPDLDASFFRPERIAAACAGHFQQLDLRPLSPGESRKLVTQLLGSARLPAGLEQSVEARAEGNPFYVQEILRSLIASRSIEEDGKDGWRPTGRSDLAVPDTLQGIIASRVDRLPVDAGRLIRFASVVGRSFPVSLLSHVAGTTDVELAEPLRRLEEAEMLRSIRREPQREFSFTHALMQEAVYESIPMRERRILHERVAEGIERLPSVPEDRSDLLAYHHSKAERWDLAQKYLFAAGENARLLGSKAAGEYYRQALEALLRRSSLANEHDEEQFLSWFLAGGVPLLEQGRLTEIFEPLHSFHARTSETFGPTDRRTLAAAEMLGGAYFEKLMWPEGIAILESTLAAREAADGPEAPSLARSMQLLGGMLWANGRDAEAETILLRGIRLQKASSNPDLEVLGMLYTSLGGCYLTQGNDPKARASLQEALAIPGLERTHNYCGLLINLCEVEIRLGLSEEAEYHGRLGSEWGSAYLAAFCRANLGFALRTFGRSDEARKEQQRAVETFDALQKPLEMGFALSELAECQLQLGELDAATESARRVANLLEEEPRTGFAGSSLGTALWTLAGVELARDNLGNAERLLAEAAPLIVSEHTAGDPFWEAEFLYRRGQLRLKQGRRDEADADVTRATELLAELGGEAHGRRKLMLAEWKRIVAEA